MAYNRVILWPYSMRVSATKDIVKALRAQGIPSLRVYPDRNYKDLGDLIINWGNSRQPKWDYYKIVNQPLSVGDAVDKRNSFFRMRANWVSIPEYSLYSADAKQWLKEGKVVIGRKITNGHGGKGIVVMKSPEDFQECPLYTQYINADHEFRIHVFNKTIIDIQQKKRKKDWDGPKSDFIRNHGNGWIFARQNIDCPEDVKTQASKAVEALGLDFGGVDVVWNELEQKAYVLEVNSAPGMEGTTVTKYVEAITNLYYS